MSKRDGTLFRSALFGYKKSDVNDYIRRADISYDDQLSLLQSENERLLERAKAAEAKIEEMDKLIGQNETEIKARIESISQEYETKLKEVAEKAKGKGSGAADTGNIRRVKKDVSRSSGQKRTTIFGMVKKK